MNKGIFVTVEGPNGVGKSTFIDKLIEMLPNGTVYKTREPSETDFGRYVKNNEGKLQGEAYAYLIAADRCFHVRDQVKVELDNGKIVISDRYVESSFVLQAFDGVSMDDIWRLNCKFQKPDLSVVLMCSSKVLEDRLASRDTLTEYEKKMTRVDEVQGYKKAVEFLSAKGYHFIEYTNDTEEKMMENLGDLVDKINSLIREK